MHRILERMLAVVAVLALTAAAVGCSAESKQVEGEAASAPDTLIHLPRTAVAGGTVAIEEVREEEITDQLALAGQVQADPLRIGHVAPRVRGTVASVHVVVGDHVQRGQVLATLASPEYAAAMGDYLLAHRRREVASGEDGSTQTIAESARERLLTLGASPADIAEIDSTHQAASVLPLRSPITGVVTEVETGVGKLVEAGTDLFGVANLSEVWAVVDAYERDFGRLRLGQAAAVTATAYPGLGFSGRIASLEGSVKEATRTLSVRIRVSNPRLALKPGMFVTASVSAAGTRRAVVVGDDALQDMGGKAVVFVAVTDSTFVARPVEIRRGGGKRVEVLRGLSPGERIASVGAFLLKSQASKSELGEE